MSSPAEGAVRPVYLGGPLHGQPVEFIYRNNGGSVMVAALEPPSTWAEEDLAQVPPVGFRDPLLSVVYVTYQPQQFILSPGDLPQFAVWVWVDTRLCPTGVTVS